MSSEFKAVIVNEATGEIEYLTEDILDVVDTSLGSVSHEVEVVTVDDFRRRIRNSTSTTQSIVKPVVTPLLSPSGSSTSGLTGNVTQQPAVLRNTPSLLRNSRASSARTAAGQASASASSSTAAAAAAAQAQNITANVTQNEVIFLPQFQLEGASSSGGGSNPSVLPPASAQFIRTVEDGSGDGTQLIVYNCGDNQFDLIGDDSNNVQLRLCQVLQDDGDEGGQSTIYICEQEDGGISFAQGDEEYSNIQVVEELPILQDEHGNVYEVEEFTPGQLELEMPIITSGGNKRRKKGQEVTMGRGGISSLVAPVRMSKRPLCELKCLEVDCNFAGMNIGELRKHLTAVHGLPFDEETIIFQSDKDFKLWREQYERERMVSFIFRGGTKKISREQAVTYLICHRSGHYKPTMKDQSLRKRKMKPQGSCKMNGYCTAGIKLLKNLESGEVKCEICHTHYGHPLDNEAIPHLRVNNVLRKIIWKKFEDGMTFNQVVQYLHHNPDHLEGLRLLDRRAVRNIYDKFRKNPSKKYSDDELEPDELSQLESRTEESAQNVTPQRDTTTATTKTEIIFKLEPLDESTTFEDDSTATEMPTEPMDIQDETTPEELLPKSPEVTIPQKSPPVTRRRGRPPATKHPAAAEKEKEIEPEPASIRRSTRERKPKVFPGEELKPVVRGTKIKTERLEKQDEATKKKELEPPVLEEITPAVTLAAEDENHEPPVLSPGSSKSKEGSFVEDKETAEAKVSETHKEEKPGRPRRKSVAAEATGTSQETEEIITEGLKKAIQNLLKHCESGPSVLLYKRPGSLTPEYGRKDSKMHKDDFILIIQTPVQRQLMQMFSDIISIDLHKGRPKDLKLMWVLVLDEFREAIPVAWLISNSTEDRISSIFLRALHQETGDVQTHYIMAPIDSNYPAQWSSTFKCNAQHILNEEETKRDMRIEVAERYNDNVSRSTLNRLMSDMMSAFEESAFTEAFESFKDFLVSEHGDKGRKFVEHFKEQWYSRRAEWDLVHRVAAPVNTIRVSEAFGKLKKFIAFKGTKILSSCIEPILKIGYDKCFSRSKRIFKGDQKILKIMEDLEMQHNWGSEMDPANFEANESYYTVKSTDGKGDKRVFAIKSPCRCKYICSKCQVCIHQYLCDCSVGSNNEHAMCSHIHFVHLMINQAVAIPGHTDETVTATLATTGLPVVITVLNTGAVPE